MLDTATTTNEKPYWYLLNTLEPEKAEDVVIDFNLIRNKKHLPLLISFIPYHFLQHRIANVAYDSSRPYENIETEEDLRTEVKENNHMRNILKRYVFIKGTQNDLNHLFTDEETMEKARIMFLSRGLKEPMVCLDDNMDRFVCACMDQNFKFDLCPTDDTLTLRQKVKLNIPYFAGQEAYILNIKEHNGHKLYTVGFHAMNNSAMVRKSGLTENDLYISAPAKHADIRSANDSRVIEDMQRWTLRLLEDKLTEDISELRLRHNMQHLTWLNTLRDRRFDSQQHQLKHTALALLSAWLSNDRYYIVKLTQQANRQVAESTTMQQKAYLWTAIAIANGDSNCYNAALAYYTHPDVRLTDPQMRFYRAMRHNCELLN